MSCWSWAIDEFIDCNLDLGCPSEKWPSDWEPDWEDFNDECWEIARNILDHQCEPKIDRDFREELRDECSGLSPFP